MNIKKLYNDAVARLKSAEIPDVEYEISFMLGHILKLNRAQLFLYEGDISAADELIFQENIERRLRREPLAYIIGEQEFWSLPFHVTPDVLIPRPETELLVEKTLQVVKERIGDDKGPVLELGTGSGIISIILALEIPRCSIFSVDCSFPALAVARANALRHKVYDRVHLINSDWLSALKKGWRFPVIVSNPPYVARETLAALQPEVNLFEPHLALDGGDKGMEIIRMLAVEIETFLEPDGWFLMEIGSDQEDLVIDRFSSIKQYDNIKVHRDYAGLPRVFQARHI
ncbi:MAG: peptide chain release factor N(5)-glutamine methyltransferase [Proteobacteria bacterium]|nr:peptide chain release factor N(5)-glutamine methyltransferase [Pseudomonadota bacterium]MBU1708723.1 peptide chain release factor N(5)-glutamine methyltransferase [Pseudomonadota bacterium]